MDKPIENNEENGVEAEAGGSLLLRMDELVLPPHLDGRSGSNRSGQGRNQLGVDDDLAAVRLFLSEYAGSPATARSYRKEIERLLLWSILERRKPLSSLDREDFAAYAEFLGNPQPVARWCGVKRGRAGPRFSAAWRPFVGPLGPASRKTALIIINSLMSYLVQAGYLAGNPLGLMRQRGRVGATLRGSRRAVWNRSFDDRQWNALLDALDELKEAGEESYERARFIVALLHFLALRVGELTTHTMGDFVEVRGRWIFCVTGKGGKSAEIPVNGDMLQALAHYRQHLGLPPLPAPHEDTPLVLDTTRKHALTARRINQLLKKLLARAARGLSESDPERAERMERASAHWFRHTALTRQAEKGIPLIHVKANARHSKLDTTLLYVHADDESRHEEMRKHTWR